MTNIGLEDRKTKNYHWNVTGPHFYNLHGLFGDQYTMLDQLIDQIEERVRRDEKVPTRLPDSVQSYLDARSS